MAQIRLRIAAQNKSFHLLTESGDKLHDAHQDCREVLIDGVALRLPEDGLEAEDDGVDAGPLLERLQRQHHEKRSEDRATEHLIGEGPLWAEKQSLMILALTKEGIDLKAQLNKEKDLPLIFTSIFIVRCNRQVPHFHGHLSPEKFTIMPWLFGNYNLT